MHFKLQTFRILCLAQSDGILSRHGAPKPQSEGRSWQAANKMKSSQAFGFPAEKDFKLLDRELNAKEACHVRTKRKTRKRIVVGSSFLPSSCPQSTPWLGPSEAVPQDWSVNSPCSTNVISSTRKLSCDRACFALLAVGRVK